jgi:hypothetical protein
MSRAVVLLFPVSANQGFNYKKSSENLQSRKMAGKEKHTSLLSQKGRKASNSISDALLQIISKILAQGSIKTHRKALHELTVNIAKKPMERKRRRAADKRLHASITIGTQCTVRSVTHAKKPENNHHDS